MNRTALLAALLLAHPAPARESFQDLLAAIDQQIAAETAILAPAQLEPVWIDGRRLLVADGAGSLSVDLVDAVTGVRTRLCEDGETRAKLSAQFPGRQIAFRPVGLEDRALLLSDGTDWVRISRSGEATLAPDAADSARLQKPRLIGSQFPTTFEDLTELPSPDGSRFLTLDGHDLALRSARDGSVRHLTTDGTALATWRSSEESEQRFPAAWSPDGRWIAAVRLDLAGVPHEPLMRWLATPPAVDRVPYPRAGEPMPRFGLALFDPDTGARRQLELGDTHDQYVNIIGFSGDSRHLLVQVIDRAHKHWRLLAADTQGTGVRTLLEERRATYLDTPMTLAPVLVRPLAQGFLHLSEESGFRQIARHDDTGRRLAWLTQGKFVVEEIVAIDEGRGWVYFLADLRPGPVLQARLHRVSLAGGRIETLTGPGNVERAWFAPDMAHVVVRRSGPDLLPVTESINVDSRQAFRLSQPPSAALASLPKPIFVSAPAAEGKFQTGGLLYLPPRPKPGPIPAVEIIYGGMQLDFVPRQWFGMGMLQGGYNALVGRLLLARGFAVAYVNAPGTPNRGRAFQDATYGRWPQTVIPNHAAWWQAARQAVPALDPSRLGIFGNSWGGYLAQRAMIEAPGLYRAAVSMAPPSDFVDHPTYIEPFMGLPSGNPAGYAAASNLAQVAKIRGPVLVMPMPLDVNAGFSPGMKFVDAMVGAGKEVELFTLPDVNHRITCCGWQRERHAYAVVLAFLSRNLLD